MVTISDRTDTQQIYFSYTQNILSNSQIDIAESESHRLRRTVLVSGVGLINEVNQHWARLILGWVSFG